MSYAKDNMVKIEANNNRGCVVIFVEIDILIIVDSLLFSKDHQHDEDDKYDYECVEERKS
jgi:hypothetical protein